MRDFKILADSCCDLPDDILKKFDIDILPYYVSLNGKDYLQERVDIPIDDFFDELESNKNLFPKTSFPSTSDITDFFCKYLKDGLDILFISMTSKFSGGFQTILNIGENLKADYPAASIVVVDSVQVSVGEGLLAIQASKMRKDGRTLFETAAFINSINSSARLNVDCKCLGFFFLGFETLNLFGLIKFILPSASKPEIT